MGVTLDGKINFLSSHYQDIIISENSKGNYRIKITPNSKYSVKKLDSAYSHPNYNKLSDTEKIKSIVSSYLYNNTIFFITNNGHLKNYSNGYQATNAYRDIFGDYKSFNKAMYIKIFNEELLSNIYHKIIDKYKEDRINHINQILNCDEIFVNLSLNTSSYYINNKKAYINLFYNCINHEKIILEQDVDFLKVLLTEFIKINGYRAIRYGDNTVELRNDIYNKIMILDDVLMPIIMEINNEIFIQNQLVEENYHNITIEEYISSLNNEQNRTLIKKA